MFRAGSGNDGSNGGGNYELVTNIITSNSSFTMPSDAKDNQIFVRIFGGGGGGAYTRYYYSPGSRYEYNCGGGGGGWMNNSWLTITPGTLVSVTIGAGGACGTRYNKNANAGGTTSFGSYLSAAGGSGAWINSTNYIFGGNGGSGGGGEQGGRGYQFGGGGSFSSYNHVGIGGPMGGNGAHFT